MMCFGGKPGNHEEVEMDYAGQTIEDLRILRKKHKQALEDKP